MPPAPPPTESTTSASQPSAQMSETILRACAGLKFGSVEVVVHDGRIVQVVRTERMRVSEAATR